MFLWAFSILQIMTPALFLQAKPQQNERKNNQPWIFKCLSVGSCLLYPSQHG